jgi:UDP-GlcNAc:undecaprenyl-phosphate GlcNAc-1-phosphate transferase
MIVFPQWLSYILTVFWIVFFINAVNWFDGINGMASGLTTIGFLTIILLLKYVVIPAYPKMTQLELERLLFTIDLAMVFFIWSLIYSIIEWKPWGILRDVGVVFLAYALAFLSLLGGAKIGALVVVLSLMIFDAIWVGLYRIFVLKKNPMKGDYTHLHHRLQNF